MAADDAIGALFHAASGRSWTALPLQRPIAGRWGRTAAEDVVVCRLSETEFEVQCHGGEAAVRRILGDLAELGFSTVDADTQAAMSGDLLDRELQTALRHAMTWRTANILNEQASGLLRATFQQLAKLEWTADERERAAAIVQSLLAWADFGVHLSRPWSVVLTGRPNVGKSSLINALLGFRRAIVADQPGTTRDVVTGVTALDGWPVELADTAGLRATNAELEAAGIDLARAKLAAADLQVVLIDVGEPPQSGGLDLCIEWPDAIIVAHKADLPDQWGSKLPTQAIRVSSWKGIGLDALMAEVVRRLVPTVPPRGTAVPVSPRQVAWLKHLQSALASDDERNYREVVSEW